MKKNHLNENIIQQCKLNKICLLEPLNEICTKKPNMKSSYNNVNMKSTYNDAKSKVKMELPLAKFLFLHQGNSDP